VRRKNKACLPAAPSRSPSDSIQHVRPCAGLISVEAVGKAAVSYPKLKAIVERAERVVKKNTTAERWGAGRLGGRSALPVRLLSPYAAL
jgi:hypothetical protein